METEKSLCNVNFYMHSEVCKWLFNKFGGKDNTDFKLSFGDNDNFSYDVIDQPFHCEVKVGDGDAALLLYIRSDFGIYEEQFANIHMVFHSNREEPTLIQQNGIGGDINATASYYLKVALQLRKQISTSFYESIVGLDLEKEGILVSLKDDDIAFEKVSGRKRPSMLCNSLFEGMHMGRPYLDEQTSGLMRDMMSMEVKLAGAEEGDEDCMEDVALTYLNGNDEVEQDFEKSAYWWEKLAEAGNSQAQFNLGLFYAKGCGVTRDFEKASEWMKKALDNGDDDAQAPYEAYSKAAENLKKAEAGDAVAQAEMAKLYTLIAGSLEQFGSGDDYKAAFEWAKKSADQGNTDALWTLALAYEHGRGVEEDKNKAIELYSKGAELNHPDAMNSLGACILKGEVADKTKEDAFELIKRAVEMGNVLAMRNLGHCYQFEEGTDHDMKKAIFWYEKYLEHENDAELAQKVAIFKTLPDLDENDDSEQDNDYARVDQSEFSKNLKKIEFKDKLFVLTGFDTAEENKITKIITERGGIIKSSTVLKTDYLVVKGDYSSRKYERAVELNKQGKNIAIISVEQFYELVNKENKNNTENKNSKENKNNKSSKNNTFDDKMTFDLPYRYELISKTNDDGEKEYQICYGVSIDEDGEKQAEKTYSLKKGERKASLVSNVDGAFPVQVRGFTKDFNIGLNVSSTSGYGRQSQIVYKIYLGMAIIEYKEMFYFISTWKLGTDDYQSRSDAAEEIATGLSKVLGFINLEGNKLNIKSISKSLILQELKKEKAEIETIDETLEEKAARLEKEEKEKKARLEKERLEKERKEAEKKRGEKEKRKAEEERKRKKEEEKRLAKEKAEAEQKAWESEVEKVKAIREDALAKRYSEIEEGRAKALLAAEEEKCAAISQCEKILEESKKELSDYETELAALGLFAFKRKGELKKSIEACRQRIQTNDSLKESVVSTYEENITKAHNKADEDTRNAKSFIEKKYPLPDSPEEKERKRKEEEVLKKEKGKIESILNKWGNHKRNYLGVLQFLRVHPGIYDAHLWNYIPQYIGNDSCPNWEVMDALKQERLVEKKRIHTTNIYGYRYTTDLPYVTKTGEQFIDKYEKFWGSLEKQFPDPTDLPDSKIVILAGDIMQREDGATMAKLLEDPILNKVGSSRLSGIIGAEMRKKMMICKNGVYWG